MNPGRKHHLPSDLQIANLISSTQLTMSKIKQNKQFILTKPPASWLPVLAWYYSCRTEKCALAVNGNRRTERSPETVLYCSRQSGGFVNRTVSGYLL